MSRSLHKLLVPLLLLNLLFLCLNLYLWHHADHSLNAVPEALAARDLAQMNPAQVVVEAAQQASPAVVAIGAVKEVLRRGYDPFDFFSPFILYPYRQRLPYLGSGFLISADGHILTNHHVIEGAKEILVTLPDERELNARLLDADEVVDIALLKIEGKNFPHLTLGDSEKLLIGEWALALGNPFGNIIGDPRPTVTFGVISSLNRSFDTGFPGRVYHNMIQTDAAINPGNSGGPLINLKGEVVGINTFIVSRTGGSMGIGFAIPINRARQIVDEIMKYGHIRPILQDFDTVGLNPHLARMLDAQSLKGGAVVYRIYRGGPAQKAGLKVGDIIVKFGDKPIRSRAELLRNLSYQTVGDQVVFTVFREGKLLEINYVLQEYKMET